MTERDWKVVNCWGRGWKSEKKTTQFDRSSYIPAVTITEAKKNVNKVWRWQLSCLTWQPDQTRKSVEPPSLVFSGWSTNPLTSIPDDTQCPLFFLFFFFRVRWNLIRYNICDVYLFSISQMFVFHQNKFFFLLRKIQIPRAIWCHSMKKKKKMKKTRVKRTRRLWHIHRDLKMTDDLWIVFNDQCD